MAQQTITVSLQVRKGHLRAMTEQALGEAKRARRRDRPQILQRWLHRIADECFVPRVQ